MTKKTNIELKAEETKEFTLKFTLLEENFCKTFISF